MNGEKEEVKSSQLTPEIITLTVVKTCNEIKTLKTWTNFDQQMFKVTK